LIIIHGILICNKYCDRFKSDGHVEIIQDETDLLIDSYFSTTKIRWILNHVMAVTENKFK